MRAAYHETIEGLIACGLCPQACRIARGRSGRCGVRRNDDGVLGLPYHAAVSAAAVDPIEKKPLYHFLPGSSIYSIGFYGCNLDCPFCQNHHISRRLPAAPQRCGAAGVVEAALRSGCRALAYTYSEPLIHAEYVLETAARARGSGLRNVLVTNGFVEPGPGADILSLMDAANVDLKAFNDDFYRRELGGALGPVLDFIREAARRVHLEVTTLVIPGRNSSIAEIAAAASFLAAISPDIPYHLSAYRPCYRSSERATTAADLAPLLAAARGRLRYVYAGNLPADNDTRCPHCGCLLIERRGPAVRVAGLRGGSCAGCGRPVAVVTP